MSAKVIGTTAVKTGARASFTDGQRVRVPRPAGAQPGDLLVTFVGTVQDTATQTAPGHTELGRAGGNSQGSTLVAYRVVRSGDPTSQDWVVFGNVGADTAINQVLVRGQEGAPTAPLITGPATSHPGLTTVGNNALVLWAEQPRSRTGYGRPPVGPWAVIPSQAPERLQAAYRTFRSAGSTGIVAVSDYVASASGIALVAVKSLDLPPTAPTLLSPRDNVTVDRQDVIPLIGRHKDPDGLVQRAFAVRYRQTDTATAWTTEIRTSPDLVYYVPPGLVAGPYEWQGQTVNTAGLTSPWSESVFFTAGDAPAVTITSPPGPTVPESVTVTWTDGGHERYEVDLVSTDGTVLATSGSVLSSAFEHTLSFGGLNGTDGRIRVRVEQAGLPSPRASVGVTVSFVPPPTPSVSLLPVNTLGTLRGTDALDLTIRTPAASGGTPVATSATVRLRSRRIPAYPAAREVKPNGTWRFWTPDHLEDYEAQIVNHADNGTTSESPWTSTAGPVVIPPIEVQPPQVTSGAYAGSAYAGQVYAGGGGGETPVEPGTVDQGAYEDIAYDTRYYQ